MSAKKSTVKHCKIHADVIARLKDTDRKLITLISGDPLVPESREVSVFGILDRMETRIVDLEEHSNGTKWTAKKPYKIGIIIGGILAGIMAVIDMLNQIGAM